MTLTSWISCCLYWNSWTLRKGCRELSLNVTSYVRFMIILFSSRLQALGFDTQDERAPMFVVSCEILPSRFARNLLWVHRTWFFRLVTKVVVTLRGSYGRMRCDGLSCLQRTLSSILNRGKRGGVNSWGKLWQSGEDKAFNQDLLRPSGGRC